MTDPLIDKTRELRLEPMRCTSMARAFEGDCTLSESWCADGSVVDAFLTELEWNPDTKVLVFCDWG